MATRKMLVYSVRDSRSPSGITCLDLGRNNRKLCIARVNMDISVSKFLTANDVVFVTGDEDNLVIESILGSGTNYYEVLSVRNDWSSDGVFLGLDICVRDANFININIADRILVKVSKDNYSLDEFKLLQLGDKVSFVNLNDPKEIDFKQSSYSSYQSLVE